MENISHKKSYNNVVSISRNIFYVGSDIQKF